jgi:hypothetical protein
MLQFHRPDGKPSLTAVMREFDLSLDDVDAQYGVVPTDPVNGFYVIRVRDHALAKLRHRLQLRGVRRGEGLFGDPAVESF